MNRSLYLFAAIATVLAGVAVAAPQSLTAPAGAHAGTHAERGQRMLKLDSNGDGVIDRAEAATHPRFAAMFDRLNANKDGRLEASERPKWKGKHGHRGHRGGIGQAIALDTDGDGRISKIEAGRNAKFAERFDQTDANRDGYLVRSELMAAAENHRAERKAKHEQRSAARFAKADSNRDGKLSRAEVEAEMPRMAERFAFMDEDRDGFLTRADLEFKRRR